MEINAHALHSSTHASEGSSAWILAMGMIYLSNEYQIDDANLNIQVGN